MLSRPVSENLLPFGHVQTIVPTEPPAQRAPAVLSRLRAAQRELADLKLQIPERALAAAEGKPGARESLAELRRKISEAEFEIASNSAAREYAERLDEAALVSWIQDVQKHEPRFDR